MIHERDEDILWETVALLKDENHIENAQALFRSLVDKTFSMLKLPTDFLHDISLDIPPRELFLTFKHIDRTIHQLIELKEIERANEHVLDYIDLLTQTAPYTDRDVYRKKILVQMLNTHSKVQAMLDERNIKEIDSETYTSSEASEIVGVSDQTIRRWCEKRKYPDAYQTEGGHWRIPEKYFSITHDDARKRRIFENKLNKINKNKGDLDESEFL
ncbi:helix-turn-helix domain-containing protein [Bacillus sp. DJP31]|uniref:helix-turn-helix domain-containing protein n=1 Tax=Bacillus sp. DJP31 TaxID=3409789 RepID=UPI003BB5F372